MNVNPFWLIVPLAFAVLAMLIRQVRIKQRLHRLENPPPRAKDYATQAHIQQLKERLDAKYSKQKKP